MKNLPGTFVLEQRGNRDFTCHQGQWHITRAGTTQCVSTEAALWLTIATHALSSFPQFRDVRAANVLSRNKGEARARSAFAYERSGFLWLRNMLHDDVCAGVMRNHSLRE